MARNRDKRTLDDPADIASVYEEYRPELSVYISGRVRSSEEAEDILQNVFFNLSRIDLAENPIEQISSWLYAAVRNQITDRWRKKKEDPMPVYSDEEEGLTYDLSLLLAATEGDPEQEYIRSLVWVELEEALQELPVEQRSVFELTELQGVSFNEIAESTGLPVNTLISRKRYAVLHLRERLAAIYDEIVK